MPDDPLPADPVPASPVPASPVPAAPVPAAPVPAAPVAASPGRAAPRGRRRLLAGAAAVVVVLAVVGVALGWGRVVWNRIDARFRLDVGAPAETAPYPGLDPDPVLRLAVAGDVGTGGAAEYATAAAMDALEADREFDALLLLGDNVYPSGDADQVQAKVLDPFDPVLDGPTRLVATLGNHDIRSGEGDEVAAALGMPARWYTEELGPVRIVSVDSTQVTDPDQLRWLDETLTAPTDAAWTIVIQHHPPFSAGFHRSHGPSQDLLVPRYTAAGVDLVLAGHDHDYQRIEPQDGVAYVVSGAAAKRRDTARADFTERAASTHHFVELAVYPDRMELRAVDHDGRVFDAVELVG